MLVEVRLASTGGAVAVALIIVSSHSARTHHQSRVSAYHETQREGAEDRHGHENAESADEAVFDHNGRDKEGEWDVKMSEYALHSIPLRFRFHKPGKHQVETPPREVEQVTRGDDETLLRVDLTQAAVENDSDRVIEMDREGQEAKRPAEHPIVTP